MTPRADVGRVQDLAHEGRPALAQHPVILPWSKSATQNLDKLRASQQSMLHRPGVNQLDVKKRERQTEGVMDKGLPGGEGPERPKALCLLSERLY